MSEPHYVTLVAKLTLPIEYAPDRETVERQALARVRGTYPQLSWSVEHVEVPWGS